MKVARLLYQLARADLLERTRRYSFLMTLGAVLFLGYSVHSGDLMLRLERYRGVFNSAWTGGMMTLVLTTVLSLIGFYLVKNAIELDRSTGVGQILAATPLTRPLYTLGKTLSNFVFLSLTVAILAVVAVTLQLAKGEDSSLQLDVLLAPFVFVGLPCMLVVSSLAVLFEAVRWLRGGAGNVLYFFFWAFALVLALQTSVLDFAGFRLIGDSMRATASQAFVDYRGGFDLTFSGVAGPEAGRFVWNGIEWTPGVLAGRLWFVILGFALSLLAALRFDRFDSSRERRRSSGPALRADRTIDEPDALASRGMGADSREQPAAAPVAVETLTAPRASSGLAAIYLAELRMMVRSMPRVWHVVALGLFVASLFAPLRVVRQQLLPLAWIWPLLIWSGMGTREARYNTAPIVFSSPRSLSRQFPALWLTGVTVCVATGGAAAFRLLLGGDGVGLAAWAVGAVFIPSAALCFGTWSGSAKLFEACYVAAWYVGPIKHLQVLDFIGTTRTSAGPETTLGYLAAAAVMVVAATVRRHFQIKGE